MKKKPNRVLQPIFIILLCMGFIFLGINFVNSTIWNGTNIANVISWYTFNNTLNDTFSNNNLTLVVGSQSNIYFIPSVLHTTAIFFNNSNNAGNTNNSYLYTATTNIPSTTNGTVEAWVNITDKSSSWGMINLLNIFSQATLAAHNGIRLYVNSTGDRIWCQVPRADNTQVNTDVNVSLNKGVWNHVACTWNLTEIDIYLNGILVWTNYNNLRTTPPGTVTGYCIGVSCAQGLGGIQGTYPYMGSIDDVMVWNAYRNVTQINEDAGNSTITVNDVPTFYNYLDNSRLLTGSGIGLFNVSMSDFNGSVYLHINNSNYTATNLNSNVFNASVFLVNGTYSYYWGSWGNTTNHTYGQSDVRTFIINDVVPVTNWTKEVAISINFTNLNVTTNMSVLINITYDANMLSNFSDLRFWNTEKTTQLSYWFYNNTFVPSNSVKIWVKMDRNVSSSANATIYMRYGNSAVTTTSDVGKAGLFGDDFSFTDSNKWASGNMGIHVIANVAGGYNGSMSFPFATSANSLYTPLNYSNFIAETRCIFADDNEASGPSFALYSVNSAPSAFGANTYAGAISAGLTYARINGDNTGPKINGTQFFRETIAYKNATYGYVNLTNDTSPVIVQKTDLPPATQAYFEYYQANAQTSYCDWVFVRRYSEGTPTISFSAATDLSSSDNDYPSFTNYWDNNNTLVTSGVALFNITVLSTNQTVIFHLANYNILASKTGNVYNASVLLTSGTYVYNWTAYGNGSSNNFNTSAIKYYTVRNTLSPSLGITRTTPLIYGAVTDFTGTGCPPELSCTFNITNQAYSPGVTWANFSTPGNVNYSASSVVNYVKIGKIDLSVLYPINLNSILYVQKSSIFNITLNVSYLYIDGLTVNVSLASTSSLCYQETANISNSKDGDCGLIYTGNYGNDGGVWASGNRERVYDGDWGTNGTSNGIGTSASYDVNYTKPVGAFGAIWQVKDWVGIANLTVPDSCWSYSSTTLTFTVNAPSGTDDKQWFCRNATTNVLLRGVFPTINQPLYEEAIYWNITSNRINKIVPTSWDTPFFTTASNNPFTSNALNASQSQIITFWVNATQNGNYIFRAFANLTSEMGIYNITQQFNVSVNDSFTPSTVIPPVIDNPGSGGQQIQYPYNEIILDNMSAIFNRIINDNIQYSIDVFTYDKNKTFIEIDTLNLTLLDTTNYTFTKTRYGIGRYNIFLTVFDENLTKLNAQISASQNSYILKKFYSLNITSTNEIQSFTETLRTTIENNLSKIENFVMSNIVLTVVVFGFLLLTLYLIVYARKNSGKSL